MKLPKTISFISHRPVLLLWVVICGILSLYIPRYDFGFDGVKVWFCLCILMLAAMWGGSLLLRSKSGR
jgi:hypothetical protein